MFINELKNELNKGLQLTENGAVGFATSGKSLVDFNFKVSSYRNMSDKEIFHDFMKAYVEDAVLAMKLLFFVRDVRGGMGERRLFRVVMSELAKNEPKVVDAVLELIPFFGRWDDLFELMGTSLESRVVKMVAKQLISDIKGKADGKSISLLAKWMPSINCSNKERRLLGEKFAKAFGVSAKTYRKNLVELRKYLNVVEQKMSARQWSEIDYEDVPSRANLLYNSAFLKNDESRRREFLGAVEKGDSKINSATNFPHDILSNYGRFSQEDMTLEMLWKALPNYGNLENTLVVADGSGSMLSRVGDTKVTALDVANSLAIYFAEHCSGDFKNHYITFSTRPQLVNLGNGSLLSKKKIAERYSEVSDTDIFAVFRLVLETAVKRGMKQRDLPSTILIVSDMEFNSCATNVGETLFDKIRDNFTVHGYKVPRLAFWNVMSRTCTVPIQSNELGVSLISGFSPSSIKMVLSGQSDPFSALLEVLNSERYLPVGEALRLAER